MRLRVRRRLLTPRRLIVVAIIAAVGVIAAVIVGHGNRAAGSDIIGNTESAAQPCRVEPHSMDGAAVTAIDGLHQLALANIGQADVEKTLARYVTPEKRQPMRVYLKAYPAPFVAIESTVLAWQSVTYDADTAVVRLATSDVATSADGVQKISQTATTVTLKFDASQDYWRMATWHVGGANVADVVAGGRGVPCA